MTWVIVVCFLSWGFVGCLISLWLPEAVLNQSQVILVVSDWEPYLGSRGSLCISWVIVPVSV